MVCKVYFGLTAFGGGVISGTTVSSDGKPPGKVRLRGDVRRIDKSWPGRTEGEEHPRKKE